jgi:hypothetical protein
MHRGNREVIERKSTANDALAWIDEFEKTLPSEDLESLVTIN